MIILCLLRRRAQIGWHKKSQKRIFHAYSSIHADALFCFAMRCVFVAKTAKLFNFHAVWMVLFFLGGIVVALFAILTCQGYFCAHCSSSFVV